MSEPVKTIDALQRDVRDAEMLISQLAADVTRIDNKTEPAKGTVSQRLERIETALGEFNARLTELYNEHKTFADELGAVRARLRSLEGETGE